MAEAEWEEEQKETKLEAKAGLQTRKAATESSEKSLKEFSLEGKRWNVHL